MYSNYGKNMVEHSDSNIEDGRATAAWKTLPTASSPAGCQDSVDGSHDKIEVMKSAPSSPPVTYMILSTIVALSPALIREGSWPPTTSLHFVTLPPV